jgi:hypothetical protein
LLIDSFPQVIKSAILIEIAFLSLDDEQKAAVFSKYIDTLSSGDLKFSSLGKKRGSGRPLQQDELVVNSSPGSPANKRQLLCLARISAKCSNLLHFSKTPAFNWSAVPAANQGARGDNI